MDINGLRQRVAEVQSDHPGLPVRLGNLGNALRSSFKGVEQDPAVIAEAIRVLRRAVELTEADSPQHPGLPAHLGNLGLALRSSYWFSEMMSQLKEAVLCMEKASELFGALEMGREGGRLRSRSSSRLAIQFQRELLEALEQRGDPGDRERWLEVALASVRIGLVESAAPKWDEQQWSMSEGTAALLSRAGEQLRDLDPTRRAKFALELEAVADELSELVRSAPARGSFGLLVQMALERVDIVWPGQVHTDRAGAALAVESTAALLADLVPLASAVPLTDIEPAVWAKASQLLGLHVQALVLLDRLGDAFEAVDLIRSATLSSLLDVRDLNIAQVRSVDPVLAERLDVARFEYLGGSLSAENPVRDPARIARSQNSLAVIRSTIEQARELGVILPLLGPAVATSTPTVALVPTEHVGLVLVEANGQTQVIHLRGANATNLSDMAGTLRREIKQMYGALFAQADSRTDYQRSRHPIARFREVLEGVLDQLGSEVMGPLLDELGGPEELAIVACGPSVNLPLHAATVSGGTLACKTAVRYLPNRRFASPPTLRRPVDEVTAAVWLVDKQFPGLFDAELAHTREYARLQKINLRRTSGSGATTDLGQRGVLHLSAHGTIGDHIGTAALSGVPTGNEDVALTGRDILGRQLEHDLTLIMACSSSEPSDAVPDQEHSLAAAFLTAGSRGCIGSTWPMLHYWTEAYSAAFYSELQHVEINQSAQAHADALVSLRLAAARPDGARFPRLDSEPDTWEDIPLVGPEVWAGFSYHGS